MSDKCKCHESETVVPDENPYHILGRGICECGWDLMKISDIITKIDSTKSTGGFTNSIYPETKSLLQCTNPKCRLIKVI